MANKGYQTSKQKLVEELYSLKCNKKMTIEDVMKLLYVDKQLTIRQIQSELHVSTGTVHNWLDQAGISSRKMYWI